MKRFLLVLFLFCTAAQAHESVVPHTHPHGVSMLPGIDTIACGLLVLAAALVAYWKFGRAMSPESSNRLRSGEKR